MYAHPIVLNAVPVGSSYTTAVTRNVLITATMGNTVSGWDADTAAELWSINLGTPLPTGTYPGDHDIVGIIGIVSTPVVDRVNRCVPRPAYRRPTARVSRRWQSCELLQACGLRSSFLPPLRESE